MNKKTWARIWMIMIITCVICFSDWSFAADAGEHEVKVRTIAWLFNLIVGILSWIWALFAKLAGEFFTNNWVYGEVLGLDALLWQYWNITKNIANFGLGFYFVYVIFRGLIKQGKEDIVKNIKNTILWILIAGVGIQASWFLTAALVDVSTITLVVAGNLPAQMISQNSDIENSVYRSMTEYFDEGSPALKYGKVHDLFATDSKSGEFVKSSLVRLEEPIDKKHFFDSLVPNADNIAGPLYYMGYSILKTNQINSIQLTDNKKVGSSLLNLIIQGGTTIVYSIEMVVLCILALMRLLYLWMFIVLSPIVMLLWCIKQSGEKSVMELSFVKKLMEQVNIRSFLINVFKPTIIVIGIGLAMIFTILMNGIINKTGDKSSYVDLGGVTVDTVGMPTYNATATDEVFKSSMEGGLIKFTIGYVGKGLLDFIMSIITVILVYIIIKVAVQMGGGKDFVSKGINKLQDNVNDAITSLPVVPVAGYDKEGVSTTSYLSLKGFGSISEQKIGVMQRKAEKSTMTQVDEVMRNWGLVDDNALTQSQKTDIQQAGVGVGKSRWDILVAKKDYINKDGFKTDEGRGLVLNPNTPDKFWIEEFEGWLEKSKGEQFTGVKNGNNWKEMVEWWNKEENRDNRTLEDMFKVVPGSVKAYADFFGLTLDNYDWNNLKEADISRK